MMTNLFIILDEFEQTVSPPTADAYIRTAYNVITSDANNVILAVAIAVESSVKGAINIGDKWYGLTTNSPTYHPTIGQAYASYCKKQIKKTEYRYLELCRIGRNIECASGKES